MTLFRSRGPVQRGWSDVTEDISLVMDDIAKKDTCLRRIFAKNSILPAKTKNTVEVAKTVVKNSSDMVIRIMVVEGPAEKRLYEQTYRYSSY